MKKFYRAGYITVISVILLFTAVNASATDGTTFPIDKAGIAAYVNMNKGIDLEYVMGLYGIGNVEVLNETYVIGTVENDDGILTHLYVGADGWVIPYYLNNETASYIVRWNKSSPNDATLEDVILMNTLEEMINRVCEKLEVDYEAIKPDIKYYDFEYPNATNMTVIVDMAEEVTSNHFNLYIPSEFIAGVNESSWTYYNDYCSYLYLDNILISHLCSGEEINYEYLYLNFDHHYQIEVRNHYGGSTYTSGVGWVLIYTKKS